MAIRYDLMGQRKRPVFGGGHGREEKKAKKKITLARAVQGFFIVVALHVGVAVAMLLMDPGYFDTAVHSDRIGTNFCARVSHLIPAAWETVTTCRVFNVIPFLIMPGIVLLYILGRLLRGDSGGDSSS